MEVAVLCIKLLVHVLFLLCAHVQDVDSLILRLEPNRLQFFEYESLIFHCEGSDDSTGLKIVHRSKGELLRCKTTVTSKRSSCTIHNIFPEDSGQYWCESRDGKRSDIIHITVTDGPVILESPISVVEGEAVTLRCRHKMTFTNLSADFYKDGHLIRTNSTGNLSIPSVYKRDEGFYKCISGGRESAESLMAVQESHQEIHASSDLLLIIFRNILPVVMMALLLVLLGQLHCGELRGKPTEQGVSRIMMATVHSAGTNRPLTQEPLYSLIK
ncbi:low affinity immunoglobulin gamma Fc region receptor II-like [Labrus bergylta]|uniref:low affinity immunoglobulin gamma Fc region receptor II-like n=1 Tax=Labrus bergylta TaxID=56723 RepID=UPI0033134F17